MSKSMPKFVQHQRGRSARIAVALAVIVSVSSLLSFGAGDRPAGAAGGSLSFQLKWSTGPLADAGGSIAESSPTVATLDSGGGSVVVGDRAGRVYAFHLSNGTSVPGWPASLGVPIDGTPSAAPLGGARNDSIFIGTGDALEANEGGYNALNPNGTLRWSQQVTEPVSDTQVAIGVQASLSVGALQGTGPDVVAGSLDQEEYAFDATSGGTLPGWPFFTSDSVFSTAALADLYGTGQTEVIEGSDQSSGYAYDQTYHQGGHLRILNGQGGLICKNDTDQTVESSPAVGGFLSAGRTGIVMGTGAYFPGAADTNTVIAFDTSCDRQWSTRLDGLTSSSPAVSDLLGTGSLQVIEGTQGPANTGSVWVLDGTSGAPLWHASTTGEVIGSVSTADLTGRGYEDLLVPTVLGVDVFDGATHQRIAVLNGVGDPNGVLGFQNSPLVTDDPNGTVGITLAGYGCPTARCFGQIEHYEIPASDGAEAVGAGSWPEFHHDPKLTGNVGGTHGSSPCSVPSGSASGYHLVATDGGVFSFASPFCGSMGGTPLNAPVVGMAAAANRGGYWLVASDGGVFSFGGAKFYGSLGNLALVKPVVGMAATPDGNGYWLVASDGGVFAFGDAVFNGSWAGQPLAAPIMGIAPVADGLGYRLVASNGAVYAFGDATNFGSMDGQSLAAPIVGISNDVATGGYWLVAADGGIFSFQAPYYGSMGGLPLASPVVGIAADLNGLGYRLVAQDGGIFAFGGAGFAGSMGGRPLNRPVIGIAGF
jgi:hypothetical protein